MREGVTSEDLDRLGVGAHPAWSAAWEMPSCSRGEFFYDSVINASPNGPENGNADSPLNETERYNLTNRTQPRFLGLAVSAKALESGVD